MADNVLKTPPAQSINYLAQIRARDEIAISGRNLPASVVSVRGSIVKVKFELSSTAPSLPQVTIPLFGPEYVRYPIQIGDKGMVVSADAYLGGLSGLGGGVADLTQRANLAALVFLPFAATNWSSVDANILTLYGPGGVTLRDTAATAKIEITSGNIKLSAGGHQIEISSAGVVIDGRPFLTHQHVGVRSGTDDTGGVL